MGESTAKQQDEDRIRELCERFGLVLRRSGDADYVCEPRPDMVAALTAAFAEVRREAIEAAVNAVAALEAPGETTDANIGQAVGLCRAEAAVRALAPEPPDQPGAGGEAAK